MRIEMRLLVPTLLIILVGCDTPVATITEASAVLNPGIAARYDGGLITVRALELDFATARTPACTHARSAPGGGSMDDLIPCYREVAEAVALEHIVLAGVADLDQALDQLDDNFSERRNAAFLDAWSRQLAATIEPGDDEIEDYFQANQADMGSPRQFSLFNIFRRHRNPADPDKTAAFLIGLKSRIDAGETFAAIAREYSDSETRLRDGRVGHLAEDTLPARLQQLAADLDNGQISEPLMVKGGAVLIMIDNITPATQPELEALRPGIRQVLIGEKSGELIKERIAGFSPPGQSVIYHQQDIIVQLDTDDPEQTIFELGDQQLSVSEFRRMVGLNPTVVVAELAEDVQQQIIETYENIERRRLLIISLLASTNPAEIQLREKIEEPLLKERQVDLVDKILQQDMWQSVDQNPAALERFYRDNDHHYQTALKFKLHIWNWPFEQDPTSQMEIMERTRLEMASGKFTLSDAAEEFGGGVEDLGWRELSELSDLPQKAQSYLLQATPGGYSIPYQQDDALHMMWLEAQQEPEARDYESVRDQVREDYFDRFERKLFQQAVSQRLDAAHFVFSADNVRLLLMPPEPGLASALP